MDEENMEEDKIFNNDPLYMTNLIGKNVQVELVDKETYTGIVYVIDPVFKNLVIHERTSNDLVTRMILHHAIKSLVILSDEKLESYINGDSCLKREENEDAMKQRRALLKGWFQHMCLDVEESGDCLKIDDNLVIVPPYGPDNCICNNTLILERIQNIIISMPFTVNT